MGRISKFWVTDFRCVKSSLSILRICFEDLYSECYPGTYNYRAACKGPNLPIGMVVLAGFWVADEEQTKYFTE